MMATAARQPITLAIHPNARGFGWVAFEGPLTPFDWGLAVVRGDKNSRTLKRIEDMIERLKPETLVLEAFDQHFSLRRPRIARLCRATVALAADRGVDIAIYTREEVVQAFVPVGARTRHDIAEAVARHFEGFRHRLPPRRRPWQCVDRRMSLFCAAALLLTHFQLSAQQLLDDLAAA